jgi:hypothetical protein
MKLEGILNILSKNQVNLVICGDFNVNFMTKSTNKSKITSLLRSYNLDYVVDFPTHITTNSASTIDNIFLDRSRNKNFITEPYYNGLSDHDALMLTLHNPSYKHLKPGLVRIGRYYDDSSIREFKLNLSYENWEHVFNPECDNDVNVIFNNFLNYIFKDILFQFSFT